MGWGLGEVMGSLAEIVRSLIEIATLAVMFFFIFDQNDSGRFFSPVAASVFPVSGAVT